MGGIIGMMIAAAHKPRIGALVLNDVGATVSADGLKRILGYVGFGSAFDTAENAMNYLKSILAPFHITTDEHWQHMFTYSFVPLPGGRYAFAYDPAINPTVPRCRKRRYGDRGCGFKRLLESGRMPNPAHTRRAFRYSAQSRRRSDVYASVAG